MNPPALTHAIAATLQETSRLHAQLPEAQIVLMVKAAQLMTQAIRGGHKIIWCGNGGSATQSQHMAGEFVGRFQQERRSLPSISLTENMASVTAIGNDYGYEDIFSRQVEGLAQTGDVLVGLSTSGNSPNVLKGLRRAKELTLATIGLTGGTGGTMAGLCDVCICVPSPVTARIQEVHLTIGHILCGLVEDALQPAFSARRA
ncbi:MAG: SIS domain-containing protein [Candidatus Omnitrophica bacterium]|nr:SIS domain-containing protein [Candidatus Omnitrophota bacterium]